MLRLSISAVLAMSVSGTVLAQGLHAVRPLPGHVCMQLALAPADLIDPKVGIPVREMPSSTAHVVGYAANTMIVQVPQQPTAGFLKVLWPGGESGWMEAAYLRPWSNPFAPNARCVPSVMSDGKPGFGSAR